VRRISRTMFVRAAEMVRRPGLFRAENDADACRSFAAVEWHYSDRLLAEDNGLWLREGDSAHRFNRSLWHATRARTPEGYASVASLASVAKDVHGAPESRPTPDGLGPA
jgi:hypothetical protein